MASEPKRPFGKSCKKWRWLCNRKKRRTCKSTIHNKGFVGEKMDITFELEIRSSQTGKSYFAAVAKEFEIVN